MPFYQLYLLLLAQLRIQTTVNASSGIMNTDSGDGNRSPERSDAPFSSMRWALCKRLSQMAAA